MAKLLYYDGATAVCDFGKLGGSNEKAIKLLLEVDANAPDERHMKQLVQCWGIASQAWSSVTDEHRTEIRQKLEKNGNAEKLRSLGYSVSNGVVSPVFRGRQIVVSVHTAVERVKTIAAYIQYLGNLHLLIGGDESKSNLIPDVKCVNPWTVKFDAVLPWAFIYNIDRCKLITPAQFNSKKIKVVEDGRCFSVPVIIDYSDMMRTPFGVEPNSALRPVPNDDFEVKRVIASALLVSLISYQTAAPFTFDEETLALKRNDADTFTSTLAEAIVSGKICACPWCGRPMLLQREKAMRYCTPTCRTLYNREAKRMLKAGATVEEIHESFPVIQIETIRGWLPMEGR